MDWLVDGWQQRTEQKLAFAGCMAAVLSLRSDPLRTASRLRNFGNKLVGYGCAALIFSGVQETCRAVRGRHDFLNSALSGAVTGALVVGHYQGPQYRLLGIVTWGSLAAALHIANSVLQPRYHLEEYLIREGLLSPEAARYRQALSQQHHSASSEVGLLFPEYEHRDILLEAKAIKERELRRINEGATAGTAVAAAGNTVAEIAAATTAAEYDGDGIPDDDPGYQTWLRTSGFQSDALLEPPPQTLQQSQRLPPLQLKQEAEHQAIPLGSTGGDGMNGEGRSASSSSSSATAALPSGEAHGGGLYGDVAPAGETAVQEGRSWSNWIKPWKWQLRKGSNDKGTSNAGKSEERHGAEGLQSATKAS